MTVQIEGRDDLPGAKTPAATRRPRFRAPWWLWAAAVVILIPVLVPIAGLFVRVLAASDSAWNTLFSPRTAELIARSALLVTAVTASALAIGVAAAWLGVRTALRWSNVWGVLVAMPLVIPSYVIALSYLAASGPRGLIADATGIGLPVLTGFPGAWLALTLATYPYVFLITAASLRRIDPAFEEAAAGLGAGGWRAFRTVTLPQLRPAMGTAALLVGLYTLSDFGSVSLMRYDVFTRVIYSQYSGRLDRTPAAVLSMVLILIALLLIIGEERTRGRATYYSRRPNRAPTHRPLRPTARAGAYAFLGSLVVLGVLLPVGVLIAWVVRGLEAGESIRIDWAAVGGSIVASTLAALIAMAAAVPIAVLTVRYAGRSTRWLQRSVYVTFSLPHIAVALAVVFFAVNFLGPLYQSLALLVVVYAAIFLAQATGSAEAALRQVNPSLEEASRSLGRSALATLTSITIPLIWKGLLAGGALVFLTTMKELPVTLILRPTGFDTLAIRVWSAADELFYARAAASALVLLLVAAVPMYFLAIRNREYVS